MAWEGTSMVKEKEKRETIKERTTKERIVYESLKLFSQQGYHGVSMREIAAAVGMKGASLYNHFKGKEDIFQAIFSEMTKQYDAAAMRMHVPMEDNQTTVIAYSEMQEKQLLAMAEGLFEFFTQNEFAVLFRKLIISEQHKSDLAAKCLKDYYLEGPILFQSHIFEGLQKIGNFKDFDVEVMAIHFYSPIYYILSRFDAGYSYEEGLEQVKKHVQYFCKLYRK